MSSCSVPEDLLPWALNQLGLDALAFSGVELAVVAGDASNRRYFRLVAAQRSYILAEAPPATEKNHEFVQVQQALARGGINVPKIFAVDLARGYLLLEDMGDRQLLPELNDSSVDAAYAQAFTVLEKLAAIPAPEPNWPAYDRDLLSEELSRFTQWFTHGLLGRVQAESDSVVWKPFAELLVNSALEQPRVLVHRDFHSRNLMVQVSGDLAVIDFQDAVLGPITYDAASLLRDCYIRWPAERVELWARAYYQRLQEAGHLDEGVGVERFLRWFDWMGLQRHIKVLGTFARLYLRDSKESYLRDLPLVLAYTQEILEKYAEQEPAFAEFLNWLRSELLPVIKAQSWSIDK